MEQAGGAKKRGRPKRENNPKLSAQERALARCNKKGRSACAKKCVQSVCKSDDKCLWVDGEKRKFCRKAKNRKPRYTSNIQKAKAKAAQAKAAKAAKEHPRGRPR